MEYLIDQYTKICLKYWKNSLEQLFNAMIEKSSKEEVEFMAENFELFIKAGEYARNAPAQIRNELMGGLSDVQ